MRSATSTCNCLDYTCCAQPHCCAMGYGCDGGGTCWTGGNCFGQQFPCGTPAPTSPAPITSATSLRQLHCTDTECSENCVAYDYALDHCDVLAGGGSSEGLTCDSSGYVSIEFPDKACSSGGKKYTMQVGACLQANPGSSTKSFINT